MERIIFLTFFIPFYVTAQDPFGQKADASSLALGGTGLCRINSWIGANNAAALAFSQENSISSSHRQVYGLDALQKSAVTLVLKTFEKPLAYSIEYFGFQHYNQSKMTLAYGQKLSSSLAIGLRIGVEAYHIEEGSSAWIPSAEIYLYGKANSDLSYAIAIRNPFSRKLSLEYRIKPSYFSLGAQFQFNEELSLALESETAWEESLLIMTGLEYQITDAFFIRIGSKYLEALNFSGGIGLDWKRWGFNMSYLQSQAWGAEICFDFNYQF
jgi:opacity protein-like surface antigen